MAQVVVGHLRSGADCIDTETGFQPINAIEGRAAWSWLRLQHGRSIDDEIKAAMVDDEGKTIFDPLRRQRILMGFVQRSPGARELQYILDDRFVVKAVASLDHLLIPPEEVERTAKEILAGRFLNVEADPILDGLVATDPTEVSGLYMGFHLHPGDILTRRAISVSSYVYTLMCTNPLTWAGIGNFSRFGLDRSHERILRIAKRTELRPRLEAAIDDAEKNIEKLHGMVDYAKANKVDPHEARVILTAFAKAYGLGDKIIQELLGDLPAGDLTTYDMSQAAAFTARHGHQFKEAAEDQRPHARQSMATVGAAALLIGDPGVTYEKANKWLLGRLHELPDFLKAAL